MHDTKQAIEKDTAGGMACLGCAVKWCEFPDRQRPARCTQDALDKETSRETATLYASKRLYKRSLDETIDAIL